MRILTALLFLTTALNFKAQPLTDQAMFSSEDSLFYFKYESGKFCFYNRDSVRIFDRCFDEFPTMLTLGFYVGEEKGTYYVFNPRNR